jgi:membrane-bound lytic murein transglycosylase D
MFAQETVYSAVTGRLSTFALTASLALALAGCAHGAKKTAGGTADANGGTALGDLLESESDDVISADSFEMDRNEEFVGLSDEARRALKDIVANTNGRAPGTPEADLTKIPAEMNAYVERWIHFFTVKDRERFQRFLTRGSAYREVVQEVLRQNNLPPELYYLAMIESGYATHARSRARAVGVWQFMRATGKRYGLAYNDYVDERRDPIRATEAAAKYLMDLYNVFHDWYLAFAAYNAGERRVLTAIMRSGSRDYWTLVDKHVLPKETLNYVPKFLAAMIIGENPDRFGFEHRVDGEPYPDVAAVEVASPIKLADVSKASGVSLDELKLVNPHLRRDVTPPHAATYEIWVPEKHLQEVQAVQEKLADYRIKGLRVIASRDDDEGPQRNYTRVRHGETLSGIARRNHVSVAYLRRVNGLNNDRIFAGMRLRVSTREYHRRVEKPVETASSDAGGLTRYRVRKGDNLNTIARKFGMTVAAIKKINGLRRNTIFIGQKLKVEPSI